ncbi:hypothetical protein IE53DRAFT_321660, partial [Violaceomyces palustris]
DGADSDEDETQKAGRLSPKTGLFLGGGAVGMKIGNILDGLPGEGPKSIQSAEYRDPIRTVEGAQDLDEIMKEYGSPVGCSAELLGALPSRQLCQLLLDHFFDEINWMRQPIPQRSLRESFDLFWASGPKLSAENINIFALLILLCAVSTLSVDDGNFPDGPRSRVLAARRYHYAGRKALLISSMLGREDLDQVVAWSMACRFVMLDRRVSEAYTCGAAAVKAGHCIGLHRDGDKLGLNPVETEARRRVWTAIYFVDRSLCLNLGRPTTIDDRMVDTLPPNDLPDDDIFPMPPNPPALPEGVKTPSPLTYVLYRHKIALIEGRIIACFQSLDLPAHYSDILEIDKEIQAMQDSVPFYFKAKRGRNGIEIDNSLDHVYKFIAVHRFLIHTEINFIRIALHRPFLLRSASANGARYIPSREACIEAALHDLELRSAFIHDIKTSISRRHVPRVISVHIGTYKWFNSLLICGIVLLMNPHDSNSKQLRDHLLHFVLIHAKRRDALQDEMRDREASVIGLFLSKIDEVMKAGPKKRGRKKGVKQFSVGEALAKRSRSEDKDVGRSAKATRRSTSDELQDEEGDHANAGLLLGLGQRVRTEGSGGSSLAKSNQDRFSHQTYADFAGSIRQGPRASAPSLAPGTYAAMNEGSGSEPWNGNVTSQSALTPSSTTESPGGGANLSPSTAASNKSTSVEDAQQIFDNWYRAEFAAAAMPGYDAPTLHYNSGSYMMGGGNLNIPRAATASAPRQAIESGMQLGNPAWTTSSGPSQSIQANAGFGTTPTIFGQGINNPHLQPSYAQQPSHQSSFANSNGAPFGNQAPPIQNQGQSQQPDHAHGAGGNANPLPLPQPATTCQTWQAPQEASMANFDPAFWQALIDKIVT